MMRTAGIEQEITEATEKTLKQFCRVIQFFSDGRQKRVMRKRNKPRTSAPPMFQVPALVWPGKSLKAPKPTAGPAQIPRPMAASWIPPSGARSAGLHCVIQGRVVNKADGQPEDKLRRNHRPDVVIKQDHKKTGDDRDECRQQPAEPVMPAGPQPKPEECTETRPEPTEKTVPACAVLRPRRKDSCGITGTSRTWPRRRRDSQSRRAERTLLREDWLAQRLQSGRAQWG